MKKNGLENLEDLKVFLEYSSNMHDVKDMGGYYPSRKCNALVVFNDTIADMISNKNLSPIVTFYYTIVQYCSYYTILFPSTKRCQTKLYPFFYYENSK